MILAPIMFLQVPLRSSSADLPSCGNLTIIEAATHPHAPLEDSMQELTRSTRLHMPPENSAQELMRFMRLHTPSRAPTCIHALSCAKFLLLTSVGEDLTRGEDCRRVERVSFGTKLFGGAWKLR